MLTDPPPAEHNLAMDNASPHNVPFHQLLFMCNTHFLCSSLCFQFFFCWQCKVSVFLDNIILLPLSFVYQLSLLLPVDSLQRHLFFSGEQLKMKCIIHLTSQCHFSLHNKLLGCVFWCKIYILRHAWHHLFSLFSSHNYVIKCKENKFRGDGWA